MGWFKKAAPKRAVNPNAAMMESRLRDSQRALLEAATSTADAASEVTNRLKQRLDDTVRQLEMTAHIMHDALIVCDNHGQVQSFNPAAEALFGYDAAAAIRIPIYAMFGDVGGAERLWEMLETEEEVGAIDVMGDIIPVEVSMAKLTRTDGTAMVLLLVHDLRDQKALQEALRYRTIFEAGFDGLMIVKSDEIVAVNPAAGRLFGYTPDELMGEQIAKLVDPIDRALVEDNLDGNPLSTHFEASGVHRDGRNLDIVFTTTTIHWDGEQACLVTVKDITEQSRSAVDTLHCMGQDFRLTSSRQTGSPELICCFDADFRITFANQNFATLYGRRSADMIGDDIRETMPREETEPFLLHIRALRPSAPSRRMQLQVTRPDGSTTVQDWNDYAEFDENGQVIEYRRIGRDYGAAITTLQN